MAKAAEALPAEVLDTVVELPRLAVVTAPTPLIAAGTRFIPSKPVDLRSQDVMAAEVKITEGMNPDRLGLAVREREVSDRGSASGGEV